MSGSHDMVVDVGFMSIEVMCNEFIKKIREERENDCWRNIEFEELKDYMVCNKTILKFDDDEKLIPVEQESRELICIGSTNKGRVKVQFTLREGCDKYEIRTEPQLISLKKNEACEFEVFIKPLCSCKMEDNIMVVVIKEFVVCFRS